jgi:hypothetical protein
MGLFVFGWWILLAALHVVIGAYIYLDAVGYERSYTATILLPSWAWGLAALVSGVLGLLAYWLIHYSALAPKAESE